MTILLPEGIEIDVVTYLVSPSTGGELRIAIMGLPAIVELEELTPERASNMVRIACPNLAPDGWRAMTRAEIADYKAREAGDD